MHSSPLDPSSNLAQQLFDASTNTIKKNQTICKYVVTALEYLKDICYKNSIFFALNNEALRKETQKYVNLSSNQATLIGLKEGFKQLIPSVILRTGLIYASRFIKDGVPASKTAPTLFDLIAGAIYEEAIFRTLQAGVAIFQQTITHVAAQSLKDNRVFQWIMSPSARILGISSFFASLHFFNGGGYLSTKIAIIQVSRIMLLPTESILYETTGNIITPIYSHLANNIFAFFYRKMTFQ